MKEETMKITYLGDVMSLRDEEFRYCDIKYLEGLQSMLHQADFVVANLETPITEDEHRDGLISKKYRFVAPIRMAEQIKSAGVTHVSVANNHCMDQGFDGLMETLACLEKVGVPFIGARRHIDDPAYVVLAKNGIRVGIVASTYGTNTIENKNWLTPEQGCYLNMSQNQELSHPWVRRLFYRHRRLYRYWRYLTNREASDWFERKELSWRRRRRLAKEFRSLRTKEHCDVVIAYPHVGGQHRAEPMKSAQQLYRWFFRRGASAVIGHHEHLVQRAEYSNSRMAAYCLGNAVSDLGVDDETDSRMENFSIALHQYLSRSAGGGVQTHWTFSILRTARSEEGEIQTKPLREWLQESRQEESRMRLCHALNTIGSRFLGRTWTAADPDTAEFPFP